MKQKLYLLLATFILFAATSSSQAPTEKQVQPYIGKVGIKKTISQLKNVKTGAVKTDGGTIADRLKLRVEAATNNTAVEKKQAPTGTLINQNEEAAEAESVLGEASVASVATQQSWSNFLSTYNNKAFFLSPTAVDIVPDPSGAVGPSQVIIATNNDIKTFEKPAVTDAPLVTPNTYSNEVAPFTFTIGLAQFFSPVLPETSYPAHPNVRYDRLSKRWYITAVEIDSNHQNNLVLLAVSDGDKITDASSFTYYSFNSSLFPYNHNAPFAPFLDIPSLGVDQHAVLIGGTQFGYDSVTYVGYVIDKAKLIRGQLVVYPFALGSINFSTHASTGMEFPVAVFNDDPAAKKSFFIGTDLKEFLLNIAAIRYEKNNKPVLSYNTHVSIPLLNLPRDMSSPGGMASVYNLPIGERRTRFYQAAIHKNKLTGVSSLWTAHIIGVNKDGGFIPLAPPATPADYLLMARTASRWYKVSGIYSATPHLSLVGTVYDTTESGRRAVQYFNPTIATNGQGHSIISGTTTAYNKNLNVFAAGRYFGGTTGATMPPVKLTNTTALFDPFFIDRSIPIRDYDASSWGDYSQTVVDRWTIRQYGPSRNTRLLMADGACVQYSSKHQHRLHQRNWERYLIRPIPL